MAVPTTSEERSKNKVTVGEFEKEEILQLWALLEGVLPLGLRTTWPSFHKLSTFENIPGYPCAYFKVSYFSGMFGVFF